VATTAKNQMIGPQLGSRFTLAAYKVILNFEGRFCTAYNYQTAAQVGYLGIDPIDGNELGLPSSLVRIDEKDDFSLVMEHRAEAILPINHAVAFRLGYTGMLLGGVSYANPGIIYAWPQFAVPVPDVASDETVYVASFTVGVEINR
jgi:hypothetical protein